MGEQHNHKTYTCICLYMHKPCTIKCNDDSFNKNNKSSNGLNADILSKTTKPSKVHMALGNKKTINNAKNHQVKIIIEKQKNFVIEFQKINQT